MTWWIVTVVSIPEVWQQNTLVQCSFNQHVAKTVVRWGTGGRDEELSHRNYVSRLQEASKVCAGWSSGLPTVHTAPTGPRHWTMAQHSDAHTTSRLHLLESLIAMPVPAEMVLLVDILKTPLYNCFVPPSYTGSVINVFRWTTKLYLLIGASVSEPHTCHVNAIFSVFLSVCPVRRAESKH